MELIIGGLCQADLTQEWRALHAQDRVVRLRADPVGEFRAEGVSYTTHRGKFPEETSQIEITP